VSERFVSKRDGWIVAVLWIASLVDFGVAAWLWFGDDAAPAFVAPLLLAAGVFQLHVLYGTDYTVESDVLRVRASFFRWHIPLAAIDSIEPTRNPLSSPACSLDRLLIRYAGGRRVMISPADKEGFLRALGQRAPRRAD
jgi:Bacterial PH domain